MDKKLIDKIAPFIGLGIFFVIAVPVFSRSFQFGIFKYFLNNEIVFIILAYFLFPITILFAAILIYSIKNKIISFIIFLLIFIMGGGFSSQLQILLMQIIIFTYFIINLKLNSKVITYIILFLILTGYFIQNEINIR